MAHAPAHSLTTQPGGVHSQLSKLSKLSKTFKTFKAHSGRLSRMQEHRGTGARERVCGDIVRLGSLEAGGWCRRWQALCEVPVRAYRVDGVADGKLFARYPCAHTGWMVSQMANSLRGTRARMQDGWTTDGKLSARYPKTGWMDNRWQTLCEVREYKCGKVWIPRISAPPPAGAAAITCRVGGHPTRPKTSKHNSRACSTPRWPTDHLQRRVPMEPNTVV